MEQIRSTHRQHRPVTDRSGKVSRPAAEIELRDKWLRQCCAALVGAPARTCELAGYGEQAFVRDELREWDYGDYEGLTTAEIHLRDPGWSPLSRWREPA